MSFATAHAYQRETRQETRGRQFGYTWLEAHDELRQVKTQKRHAEDRTPPDSVRDEKSEETSKELDTNSQKRSPMTGKSRRPPPRPGDRRKETSKDTHPESWAVLGIQWRLRIYPRSLVLQSCP